MFTDYNAGVCYGTIKKATDFSKSDLEEYDFSELLDKFCQQFKGISFVVLGYDESKEAIIGKFIAWANRYQEVESITQDEMDTIDTMLGVKCSLLCCLSIN